MSRRNEDVDAQFLAELATELLDSAASVKQLERAFRDAGLKEPLSLAHYAQIRKGLDSLMRFREECQLKITRATRERDDS